MKIHKQPLLILVSTIMGMTACSRGEAPRVSDAVRLELEKYVSGMACMPTRAFPLEETSRSSCYECGKLVDAGLLEKESDASEGESNMSFRRSHYYLTDIGESVYEPGTDSFGPDGPRFCFGNPRLVKITGTFGPVMMGGSRNYGIKFLVELESPSPYIFDERAQKLGIKLPAPVMVGKPVFYPEQNVTAVINPNNPNDFYLDSSMSIGPIGSIK